MWRGRGGRVGGVCAIEHRRVAAGMELLECSNCVSHGASGRWKGLE